LLRLALDRLPLRPFEDERVFAVVRLRPPLEPRPFDEPLLRLDDARLREPEDDALDPDEDDLEREADFLRPPDDEPPPRVPPEDDFDLRDEEARLRALDEERLRFTSPSSITPRQDPVSSCSISI
jgi:hypothetical protein